MNKVILIVEDNAAMRTGLEIELKKRGFDTVGAPDGMTAVRLAEETHPDLVLLDIMLPGMSGYEVCQRFREQHIRAPVIILTAKTSEDDELIGFRLGADDFVRKPFRMDALIARIQALLRRSQAIAETGQVAFGDFVLHPEARMLKEKKSGREVSLTPHEYRLLEYFALHAGQALSRDQLLNHVWGVDYEGTDRTVDRFVTVLRQKIEKDSKNPKHIVTVRTHGYKFDL